MTTQIQVLDLWEGEELRLACENHAQLVIITDSHVGSLYAQQLVEYLQPLNIPTHVLTMPAGEVYKNRDTKAALEDEMDALNCGRDICVLALGGGVVTDMAGFIAATYCRGVPTIYVPTSLLAMVDAAIGGKTGINTPAGKNRIGVFALPKAVFIDPRFLNTLSDAEYRQAFAEIIKHAMIADADYARLLEAQIDGLNACDLEVLKQMIARSIAIKSQIVAQDATEQGQRAWLNFGHTIGHALEQVSSYTLPHGRAVALGMLLETQISIQKLGLADVASQRLRTLLDAFQLLRPEDMPLLSHPQLQAALQKDKKNKAHTIQMVLLQALGQASQDKGVYTYAVTWFEIKQSIDRF